MQISRAVTPEEGWTLAHFDDLSFSGDIEKILSEALARLCALSSKVHECAEKIKKHLIDQGMHATRINRTALMRAILREFDQRNIAFPLKKKVIFCRYNLLSLERRESVDGYGEESEVYARRFVSYDELPEMGFLEVCTQVEEDIIQYMDYFEISSVGGIEVELAQKVAKDIFVNRIFDYIVPERGTVEDDEDEDEDEDLFLSFDIARLPKDHTPRIAEIRYEILEDAFYETLTRGRGYVDAFSGKATFRLSSRRGRCIAYARVLARSMKVFGDMLGDIVIEANTTEDMRAVLKGLKISEIEADIHVGFNPREETEFHRLQELISTGITSVHPNPVQRYVEYRLNEISERLIGDIGDEWFMTLSQNEVVVSIEPHEKSAALAVKALFLGFDYTEYFDLGIPFLEGMRKQGNIFWDVLREGDGIFRFEGIRMDDMGDFWPGAIRMYPEKEIMAAIAESLAAVPAR